MTPKTDTPSPLRRRMSAAPLPLADKFGAKAADRLASSFSIQNQQCGLVKKDWILQNIQNSWFPYFPSYFGPFGYTWGFPASPIGDKSPSAPPIAPKTRRSTTPRWTRWKMAEENSTKSPASMGTQMRSNVHWIMFHNFTLPARRKPKCTLLAAYEALRPVLILRVRTWGRLTFVDKHQPTNPHFEKCPGNPFCIGISWISWERLHLIAAPEFQLSPSPLSPCCRSVEPKIKGCSNVEVPSPASCSILRLPASADKPHVPTWIASNICCIDNTYSDLLDQQGWSWRTHLPPEWSGAVDQHGCPETSMYEEYQGFTAASCAPSPPNLVQHVQTCTTE